LTIAEDDGAAPLSRENRAQDVESLRRSIAAEPRSIELHLALAALLEQKQQYLAALTEAKAAAAIVPESAAALRALARLQTMLCHYEDAASTLQRLLMLDANDARAWFEYGQLARYTYTLPIGTEDEAFAKAAVCAGNDWLLLEMVAQFFLEQLKFPQSAECCDRIFAGNAAAGDNTVTCRDYIRSLKGCERESDAARMIDVALKRCHNITAALAGEALQIALREQALLLHEAGRVEEEIAVLRRIRNAAGTGEPNYQRPEYLPATPQRLDRLREVIGGRDVIVFLQGPSFSDFAEQMGELAGIDFAAATIGAFPPVEQELQRILGRGADIVAFTHPDTMRTWYPEFQEFLSRPANNLALATYYAISNLAEHNTNADAFIGKHDSRLLFAYPAGGPPLPSRPFHFEAGNTLSFVLPLLVIGRPQRVFLVGADGGAHPNFKRPYFYYNDIEAAGPEQDFMQRPSMVAYRNMPDRLAEANRRMRYDAINCDRLVSTSLRFLEHVFDVPPSPIFNVCPHSAHSAFPRIDVATAIEMLRYRDGGNALRSASVPNGP
jgi:tetratricopeptide (TPR) repeat protein